MRCIVEAGFLKLLLVLQILDHRFQARGCTDEDALCELLGLFLREQCAAFTLFVRGIHGDGIGDVGDFVGRHC